MDRLQKNHFESFRTTNKIDTTTFTKQNKQKQSWQKQQQHEQTGISLTTATEEQRLIPHKNPFIEKLWRDGDDDDDVPVDE